MRWLVASAALLAAATPAAAERVVAMAPLTAVGAEDTSAATRKVIGQLEAAVAALPDTKVIKVAAVIDAIKRANKPQLRSCEFDAACLGDLGKLVGADVVIAGEVVGIGDAKVIYLHATRPGKPPASTTLTLGGKADVEGGPTGAIVRLLEPGRFRGTVRFAIDVKGATVYVNGSKTSTNARGEVSLPVGTQAVRVTHPEYQDFVRFVDVPFGQATEVVVGMKQFPIVERDVQGKPINRDQITYVDPPVWRRWYVVGPAALGLAIITGVVVGYLVNDLPGDNCRKVGGEEC